MEELDHSGFLFDHQMELETRDSKIATGIMKIIHADFKRKINFLEETQCKDKRAMLTGRQITFQVFFVVQHQQDPGAMNLSDLLAVELYNDNLKMCSIKPGKKHYWALGNDSDAHDPENLYERQVRKSALRKKALTCHQQDIVLNKEPRSYK